MIRRAHIVRDLNTNDRKTKRVGRIIHMFLVVYFVCIALHYLY